MRALVIREPGGPEVLEVRDLAPLSPPFGHIRVRVAYAGINRADLLQRAGFYPAPPGAPADIPGLEYSGTVDEVGPGVRLFSGGEPVYGLVAGGACSAHLVAHEREVCPAPDGLNLEHLAAVPEAFVTAYDALVVRGRLAPGERVLIHGVGSGVGTAAVQIARALGCFVVGTSRTPWKLDRCRELGMDAGVQPEGGAFAAAVQRAVAGPNIDVVLDLIGGDSLRETMETCALKARIVVVGLLAGASAEVNLGKLLQRRMEIIGTVLRSRPLEEKIEAATLLRRTFNPWLRAGAVKPVIDRVFSLDEAAEAHRYVASNASLGKVLLRVGG